MAREEKEGHILPVIVKCTCLSATQESEEGLLKSKSSRLSQNNKHRGKVKKERNKNKEGKKERKEKIKSKP